MLLREITGLPEVRPSEWQRGQPEYMDNVELAALVNLARLTQRGIQIGNGRNNDDTLASALEYVWNLLIGDRERHYQQRYPIALAQRFEDDAGAHGEPVACKGRDHRANVQQGTRSDGLAHQRPCRISRFGIPQQLTP